MHVLERKKNQKFPSFLLLLLGNVTRFKLVVLKQSLCIDSSND